MFSLHIDTARTWRGGQNQVLLTVNGLREIGQRACSWRTRTVSCGGGRRKDSTHPARAADRNGPRPAWRLSRLLKRLEPDIIHAHDPHGVAMAALALSMARSWPSRRSSRRAASTFT